MLAHQKGHSTSNTYVYCIDLWTRRLKTPIGNQRIFVFDLGGVLVEWQPRAAVERLLKDIVATEAIVEAVMTCVFQGHQKDADWLAFDAGLIDIDILSRGISQRLKNASLRCLDKTSSMYLDGLDARIAPWIESIGDSLIPRQRELSWISDLHQRGEAIFFLSNMPAPFVTAIRKHNDLFDCFKGGIFSCDVGLIKPDLALFQLAKHAFCRFLRSDTRTDADFEIIFFDDVLVNVQAACRLGWHGIHYQGIDKAQASLGELLQDNQRGNNANPIELAATGVIPSPPCRPPHRDRSVRSFVIRAGRMGSGQSKALETLAPRYLIPFEVPAEKDRIGPSAQASTPEDDKLASYWPTKYHDAPLIIEIGFGMGDALATIAGQDRSKRYLGIDVHPPGVGSMLQLIERHNLDHVRLIQYDAVKVLSQMIAAHSVAGFHIYFPDPWPKKRHHKRRLIQRDFVKLMASRLKVGGYIHCATDWEPYAQSMLEVLSAESGLANLASGYHERPEWRPMTKFEARGLSLGHTVNDLLFRKQ